MIVWSSMICSLPIWWYFYTDSSVSNYQIDLFVVIKESVGSTVESAAMKLSWLVMKNRIKDETAQKQIKNKNDFDFIFNSFSQKLNSFI